MPSAPDRWDYLVLTASNEAQARAYEARIALRRRLGLLADAEHALVVPDPGGRRIGSGGSTLLCLTEILNRECAAQAAPGGGPEGWRATLERLRILIIHAGGDSRRLPAYGPCGKAFVPVPGESDTAVPMTLFDRQVPIYTALPAPDGGGGQVVVTSGDVLLLLDPEAASFRDAGITGLGCRAAPELASRHGVFHADPDGEVRRFYQKPSPAGQEAAGMLDRYGQSILDIGVMHFGPETAVRLLGLVGAAAGADGRVAWTGAMATAVRERGLDFYREVCCALGTEASIEHYAAQARGASSAWEQDDLAAIFDALRGVPFHADALPQCRFLHFGTTRQLLSSGADLLVHDRGRLRRPGPMDVGNAPGAAENLAGGDAWVEGCRIDAPLAIGGRNVVVGLDVDRPTELPSGACLDVLAGRDRSGRPVDFVRPHGVEDSFKEPAGEGATFCGTDLLGWLAAAGAEPADVWDAAAPPEQRTLWTARVFPAETEPDTWAQWLWMFDPASASEAERAAWRDADRYSAAEVAALADQEAFHRRRLALCAARAAESVRRLVHEGSGFSAADLAMVLEHAPEPSGLVAQVIAEARWHGAPDSGAGGASFALSRILHTLGSALRAWAPDAETPVAEALPDLEERLDEADRRWLEALEASVGPETTVGTWSERLRRAAFARMEQTIIAARRRREPPTSVLRSDEIVWGRAPARLDLAGGWTDTPPYALERGGSVLNAAVDLNGQPPIHAYARVIPEPVVRIGSIDLGTRIEVTGLADLLDFRAATSEFALAKAALALSGFRPEAADWPEGVTLPEMLERFGGGMELTTLAAIPKGSGLGTSSIVGAVLLAVVQRTMGRELSRRDLIHGVLRLEQALTTGGGWQDQIGGAVDGVKLISADGGLVPDPRIHYVPQAVLDPRANGGATLLYYTGITRLAKNILGQVVGRYLDRDRAAMATLARIRGLPPRTAEAMAEKDLGAFGERVDEAWRLNKALDPNSSSDEIEALLARVAPHLAGAKLLGAGGGGFLLMVCRSPGDAASVRTMLEAEPANDRARFFDFGISTDGLVVTVC